MEGESVKNLWVWIGNGVLGFLLLALSAGAFVFELAGKRFSPPIPILTDMADSPSFYAQEPSSVFPDGKSLQKPPEGALPRNWPVLDLGPEDAEKSGKVWENPLKKATEEERNRALARGEFLFQTYCAACHGEDGLGETPVAQRGFPPPPSLLAPRAKGYPDGRIFHIITFGQGNMPPYATQILPEDRWKIVLYLRTLQEE